MADIDEIRRQYRNALQNSSELASLRKKLNSGDLKALQKYSKKTGELSVKVLQDSLDSGENQNDVESTLNAVFRENYNAVANASSDAQKAANEASGLGLNASESGYSAENVRDLSDRLAEYDDFSEGISALSNDIVMQSQRFADDSERRSAQFDYDSGLDVLVTREYDDVGVHTTDKGGGERCQWCLERCGEDVPYEEAYRRGMFERHPGCGCIITYKTKKGIYRQGRGDWENNQWREEPNSVREKRIRNIDTGAKRTTGWEDRHAKLYYEEIRNRKPYSDANLISKNITDFNADEVEQIRNHMFIEEHRTENGVTKRFDADYDQAEAWQRLIDGKDIKESDIILLHHEKYESDIMKQTGCTYEDAHEIANKKYNWWEAVKKGK